MKEKLIKNLRYPLFELIEKIDQKLINE